MNAKTDPGARKEHAAYCSHLRDPEMEGCDCDEPEIRPFAERCGLPGTAPAPPPERCAKCGQAWGEHVGDGHDEPICPDPKHACCIIPQIDGCTCPCHAAPPPERTLTREESVSFDMAHDLVLENAALRERVRTLEEESWVATVNMEEGEEIATELFGLCCAVVDGKPDAAAARDELRKHIEHVQSCRRGYCATELGQTEKARADKAEADLATAMAALREIADFAHCDAEGFIVQPCPCPLCALSLRIAREALARIEEKK